MKLSQGTLTDAEMIILNRHVRNSQEHRNLMVIEQQAIEDIVSLALEARGLDPRSFLVNFATGVIVPRTSGDG